MVQFTVFTGITSMCPEDSFDSGSSTASCIHHWLLTGQNITDYVLCSVYSWHYTDAPPSSTNPSTLPSTNPDTLTSSNLGTQPPPSSGLPLGLVAGVAGSIVVLVLVVAVGIVVLVIWWR